MMAILGRMCTYSGQKIEWGDAINSKIESLPKSFGWTATARVLRDADGFYPVAMPGRTVCV